jgi:hypothetical protein
MKSDQTVRLKKHGWVVTIIGLICANERIPLKPGRLTTPAIAQMRGLLYSVAQVEYVAEGARDGT